MNTIYIKVYTEKSIVVAGDTTNYKESLLNYGGKWNSNLTDKISGEKFAGWIFPSSKKIMLENWLKNIKPISESTSTSSDQRLKLIEDKLDKIVSLLKKIVDQAEKNSDTKSLVIYAKTLINNLTIEKVVEKVVVKIVEEDEDEEIEKVPTKRLLKK